MRTLWVAALVGLSLMGVMDSASAQRSGRDYGYDDRRDGSHGYDDDRDRSDDDVDDDDRRQERDRSYDKDGSDEQGRRYDEDRDRDRRRGRGYDDDNRGRERGRGDQEEREAGFDEDEYLRCHPDVRRAVESGEMKSGEVHYRTFGRREGRRLTCPMKV